MDTSSHGYGRSWYQDSHDMVMARYGEDTNLMLGLLAATSANATVKANVTLARKAYGQIKATGTIQRDGFMRTHYRAILHYLESGKLNGRKCSAFYECLTNPDSEHIPVDIWMMRVYGIDRKIPTKIQYDMIESDIVTKAKKQGIRPRDYQNMLWVKQRGLSDAYADYFRQAKLPL